MASEEISFENVEGRMPAYTIPYILYVLGHCLFWDTLDFLPK